MTFNDIWNQLVRKQPKLTDSDTVVEFKTANFKRLLEQVYEQGKKAGEGGQPHKPYSDLFKQLGL